MQLCANGGLLQVVETSRTSYSCCMNDFFFDQILERREFDPQTVRLLRHDVRGVAAWVSGGRNRFGCFASFQRANSSPYRGAEIACHFLPGPQLPDGDATALFIGTTTILEWWEWDGNRLPRIRDDEAIAAEPPRREILAFDLDWIDRTDDLSERLLIRWGAAPRVWSQWANGNPKEVLEIRLNAVEAPFPGFSDFQSRIQELPTLPQAWRAALSSVKGVYLLVNDNGEQYVGSASAQDGFWGRWLAYVANGHGGNRLLREGGHRDYSVAILEVASPDMAPQDILHREAHWKDKLGARAHGLNAN